ncbi:hypothetical protein [Bradyrhizobium sp. RDM4]|uniref:hypothetical protein n=1 Tax=Bradyrhizobium sp. RDM4 TaxID=3378765 RepID=UPI0038FC4A02
MERQNDARVAAARGCLLGGDYALFFDLGLMSGKAGKSIGSSGGGSISSAFLLLTRTPIEPAPTSRAPVIISQRNSNNAIVEYAVRASSKRTRVKLVDFAQSLAWKLVGGLHVS